ncbi:hypothetical protein DJ533_12175 [Acinetobacter defluvii]|uniref:Uncharacterized protein n=1 Tax=Acinetobacter defluvii TaxID=1871111 RepID=A0A2S2FEC5_9GAMM|nr:hypothetical protein DJ533_12175 [Acinetobacter defluvii]
MLKATIEQYPCFHFNNSVLQITEPETDALLAINELLKTPLFQYKQLTFDEIIRIEQALNENL